MKRSLVVVLAVSLALSFSSVILGLGWCLIRQQERQGFDGLLAPLMSRLAALTSSFPQAWTGHGPSLLVMGLIGFTVVGTVIIVRLVKRERFMREQLALNRAIFDTMKEGLLVLRVDGSISLINASLGRMLELSPPPAQHLSLEGLLGAKSDLLAAIKWCLNHDGSITEREVKQQLPHEELRLIVSIVYIPGPTEKLKRFCVLVQDVSELSQLQSMIQTRDRFAIVGRLAANITHEIRNPLSAMDLNLQLLREKLAEQLDAALFLRLEKYFTIVKTELNRLNQFLNGFMKLSSRPKLNLGWIKVYELMQGQLDLLKPTALERKIELTLHLAPALPELHGDRDALKQVFINIIQNAFAAMPEGGMLTIRVVHDVPTDIMIFEFTDTGCGIAKENLDKIFDYYFSTKPSGSGLGLAVASDIVVQHGGEIRVDSEVGKGAKFSVRLPVAGPWRTKKTLTASVSMLSTGKRVEHERS